ncbi:UNVERIFIED_CONTAM: hypothetical protein HHA_451750 [Hammondia hammondi]|eukprot:XP_008884693.1 hypothetical protein HHA_451750 [Hammondia hammondi]
MAMYPSLVLLFPFNACRKWLRSCGRSRKRLAQQQTAKQSQSDSRTLISSLLICTFPPPPIHLAEKGYKRPQEAPLVLAPRFFETYEPRATLLDEGKWTSSSDAKNREKKRRMLTHAECEVEEKRDENVQPD